MTLSSLEFREASLEDFEGVVALLKKHAEYHANLLPHYFAKGQTVESLKKYIKENGKRNARIFVALQNGKIIGLLIGRLEKQKSIIVKPKIIGIITRAYVERKYRGEGIMGRLLKLFIDWLKRNKVKILHVGSVSKNIEGTVAWESMGFKIQSHKLEMVLK
ncbi:MAG TPA: GNAT family N-acetyltransferase [Candidatus Acidoferrum sp.]|nr:GNAT family N-acetyltransferase [Candidatus Acidoferrum sp.]